MQSFESARLQWLIYVKKKTKKQNEKFISNLTRAKSTKFSKIQRKTVNRDKQKELRSEVC